MCTQIDETIYLWPDKFLNLNTEKSDLEHTIIEDNITKIDKLSTPSLEIFKPEPSINKEIGIIVCPGGGYRILAIDLEGYEIAKWLNKLGFTVFVLKYSIPNKRCAALKDLKQAIKIVSHQSKKYNINPSKIGVLGFSAGGHLCASAAFSKEVKSVYNKTDMVSEKSNFVMLIYPAYLDEGKNNTLSPELNVDKNSPITFIFGTKDDSYANSASVLANSLAVKNVPFEFHFLPKGGHGYGLRKGNIAAESWPGLAEIWLNKNIF